MTFHNRQGRTRSRAAGLISHPALCLVLCTLSLVFSPAAPAQSFVGSDSCAGCHRQAYDDWRQSHHRQAMAEALPATVLGDFDDASVEYFGKTTRFFRRDGGYFVETQNARGETETFKVSHTLGLTPLQQYLVSMPDGRLQPLGIAWDSRPRAAGGQRWFHLYPDEEIGPGDPLHWTGAFQNWNSRCASCHTTGYERRYSLDTDSYASRWAEGRVGCEACHGPASAHLDWAAGNGTLANRGLMRTLGNLWEAGQKPPAAAAEQDHALSEQLQTCAACHSLRRELQARDPVAGYFDNFSLSPLLEGLYHPDGQILEEVFVTGSFLQSRMHQRQVSCGNCHEPHANRLRVEGNGLCLQCHDGATFQRQEHLLHAADSAGGQCVNCHMPESTYMQVDPRRDHALRIPDPFASLAWGLPNACTRCHQDRTDRWAADILTAHTGRTAPYYSHTGALAAARRQDAAAAPALLALAGEESAPAPLRGIALREGARFPSGRQLRAALDLLDAPDPLLRAAAVSSLGFLDPPTRYRYLEPLVADAVKSVRLAVAQQLSALPLPSLPAAGRARLRALFAEYERSLLHSADMPESMSDLGLHYAAQGDLQAAADALEHALRLAPGYLPALLNRADLHRAQGRDDLAEALLEEAVRRYPESGEARHALGLLYVRGGRTAQSLPLFREAAALAPDNPRYALVLGMALRETGSPAEALSVLEAAAARFPDDADIRSTLQAYRRDGD